MAKRYFKGYSTIGATRSREHTYYDIELIKRDLMNHFQTRVGERVMRPGWGCRVWEYVMEPLTAANRDAIVSEVLAICNADTRVSVDEMSVQVYERNYGLRVEIGLVYRPFAVSETFAVDFERREAQRWNGSNIY
jgi:phage baseplate assembly protein W